MLPDLTPFLFAAGAAGSVTLGVALELHARRARRHAARLVEAIWRRR